VPSAPINLIVTETGSRTANASWQEGVPPSPVNPAILSFAVYVNDSLVANTSNTSIALGFLNPFTDYQVTVAARNRIGIGNLSNPSSFMTREEGTLSLCVFICS